MSIVGVSPLYCALTGVVVLTAWTSRAGVLLSGARALGAGHLPLLRPQHERPGDQVRR